MVNVSEQEVSKHLVLFGAGMTGRGQIAQLAFEDGWNITLIDKDINLVDQLRNASKYKVKLLGNNPREVTIRGYQVYHTNDMEAINQAVSQADLVVTSVLEPNLSDVGRIIALALVARMEAKNPRPLNIIAAENMGDSTSRLRKYILADIPETLKHKIVTFVGFPDSMVSRVVPIATDPLYIITEEYSEWTADIKSCIGNPPVLNGLCWVFNQSARLSRKLYIHNTGHIICGSLGWLAHHRYIHEAALDPLIMPHVKHAIAESGEAVCLEYGFPRPEVKAYEEHLLDRLVIDALADDIRRVIRHPVRKLGKDERLIGPLVLCEKYNLPRNELCYGIAALLAGSYIPYGFHEYDNQSESIRKTLDRVGPVITLNELVDFHPNPSTSRLIEASYENLRNILDSTEATNVSP